MARTPRRYARFSITGLAVAALVMATASPALADAIDGEWCGPSGQRLAIDGPKIVTPGGNAITGNYSRHAFSYRVPANEPGAGTNVSMVLINEHNLELTRSQSPPAQGGQPERWRRCKFTS
ncbi:MAG: hypothetical protein KDJ41_02965 [Hyphomicrobiaceae bacterium]|nr:hypothetical protein [Hyphomicrobiaceae bacterium]